jgi:hypothetical protein
MIMLRRLLWLSFTRAVTVLTLISAGGGVVRADEPLAVSVWPGNCLEPCRVKVTVRTEPHPDLRALVVELDSATFFRSSLIELEGERAPSAHWLEFASLPAGHYEVRAVLKSATEDMGMDRLSLTVLGAGVYLQTP